MSLVKNEQTGFAGPYRASLSSGSEDRVYSLCCIVL
jgi:hypothetical protein